MADVSAYLADSPIAKRVKLPATLVLKREQKSSSELLAIKEKGLFGPVEIAMAACELEVGGQIVATGRIVRRRGETYLKVSSVTFKNDSADGGEE